MIWLCVRGVGISSSSFANKWEFQLFDQEQTFVLTTARLNSKEVQKNISEAAEEKKNPWILDYKCRIYWFLVSSSNFVSQTIAQEQFYLLVCFKCTVLFVLLFWKISDKKYLQQVFMRKVCIRVVFCFLQHFRQVGLIEVNGYFNSSNDHLSFAFWFINIIKEDIIKQ